MENQKETEKRELREKILAKRQEIDFDKTDLMLDETFSPENNVNPDVSDEFKNVYDPAGNVLDKGEVKELTTAQAELIHLIDRLNKLEQED